MRKLWRLLFCWSVFGGLGLWSVGIHAAIDANLTQKAAEARARQVSAVNYALDVQLSDLGETFEGTVEIRFAFHPIGQDLRIDFAEGTVLSLAVNGDAKQYRYDSEAVYVAEEHLKPDQENTVTLRYRHAYSRDGNGLYRYQDPVDKEVYLYTHFEPFAANRFFPCFDQPDLKASYKLSVTAPASWTVVSSLREKTVVDQGAQKRWTFPETLRFSTYLFALHAGPFHIWEDSKFRYPLRLMARKSLAKRVAAEEWLDVTRRGFDFFDQTFASPYPFSKYDQVAVPDFNAGAMENVAAVTFSERFLVEGKRTKSQRESLAGTVLHEMAHMWFGNLVTMRWWNDLWLNESFATYASSLAQAQVPGYENTWLSFARGKLRAYLADQSVTTHPIVAEVPDIQTAETNFDGITYAKGGAFLRQLHYVIGDAAFTEGLRLYFRKHAFSNTEVSDLIAAMEEGAKRPLKAFAESWLQTAGPNTLLVEKTCEKGRLLRLDLLQSAAPETPTLREHKVQIALYKASTEGLLALSNPSVSYQGPRTVWEPREELVCPDLVVPNTEDYDYVKVRFDKESLALLQDRLSDIREPGARILMWNSLGFAVDDQIVGWKTFLETFLKQFPKENDYEVLRSLEAVYSRSLASYLPAIPDAPLKRDSLRRLTAAFADRLKASDVPHDVRVLLFGPYVNLLTQTREASELKALLEGKQKLSGWTLEQDQRWELVQALSRLQDPAAAKLLALESERDKSSLARRQVLAAKASQSRYPDKVKKIKAVVQGSSEKSAADRISILSQLFPEPQEAERLRYEPEFVKEYAKALQVLEPSVGRAYVMSLLPLDCKRPAPKVVTDVQAQLTQESLRKSLLQAIETHSRCRRILGYAQKTEAS